MKWLKLAQKRSAQYDESALNDLSFDSILFEKPDSISDKLIGEYTFELKRMESEADSFYQIFGSMEIMSLIFNVPSIIKDLKFEGNFRLF